MYGAWRLRRGVTADAAGEGELLEETLHSCFVLALIRIDLRVRPLEVPLRQHGRGAVPRSRNEDGVQVILIDKPVEMDVGKALASIRTPMSQQSLLGVFAPQRLFQQRVVFEV